MVTVSCWRSSNHGPSSEFFEVWHASVNRNNVMDPIRLVLSSSLDRFFITTITTKMTTTLVFDDLAFTSRPDHFQDGKNDAAGGDEASMAGENDLIPAVARAPFTYENSPRTTTLNVELFGDGWRPCCAHSTNDSSGGVSSVADANHHSGPKDIICFVPGVCESAETWTVQHLARLCSSLQQQSQKSTFNMMAVLELEGHGLSSGRRAVLQPSGRRGLQRLVDQVVAFCHRVVQIASSKETRDSIQDSTTSPSEEINIVLAGNSLGGILAAYAAPQVFKELNQLRNVGTCNTSFGGCLLLSPAVGVAPEACPSPMIVNALSCLAWIAPSSSILTPEEDPSHYACPSWSTRNFKGQWPLGTSKLLLDITSDIVPNDVENIINENIQANNQNERSRNLSFQLPEIDGGGSPYRILVLTGQKDPIVPVALVKQFVDSINKRNNEDTLREDATKRKDSCGCTLVEIMKGDHGLLVRKKGKVVDATMTEIEKFLVSF